eukprot:m.264809 g.264809  ORF g.264809 m.264809 type:complete len:448 (-) comp28249_c0_seq1:95-1438(-)
MGNCHVVGPNEVMVVSGGCFSRGRTTVIGGWAWACWGLTDVQRLSLNVMTIQPRCEKVETKQGVALTVDGVAQVMVMAADRMSGTRDEESDFRGATEGSRDEALRKALQQFLGKDQRQVENTILQTLEGHLRAILGTLTVEEVYTDREQFAGLVRAVAAPDLELMGLEILSFTIKDVTDDGDYLDNLGKEQIAKVQGDATVGKADAKRDAGIKIAEFEKREKEAKYVAEQNIADFEREFNVSQNEFQAEVNQRRAESELAYALEEAKLRKFIREAEIEIQVQERAKQIEVEQQETLRKGKELEATVRKPVEMDKIKTQTLAEGDAIRVQLQAEAEADTTRLVGLAGAARTKLLGEADAHAMKVRADAYKQYGDAAIMSLVLETLPKIAAEVAAPLGRTKEIVMLGGNKGDMTGEITNLLATLPPSVQAATGLNIKDALKNQLGGSRA